MDSVRTEQDGEIINITIDSPDDGNGVNDYAQNLHATVNTSSRMRK